MIKNIKELSQYHILNIFEKDPNISFGFAEEVLLTHKNELIPELAYKLFTIKDIYNKYSNILIPFIVSRKEYSLKFLQNFNKMYTYLNDQDKKQVLNSFLLHNLDLSLAKQYIYEDILEYRKNNSNLAKTITSDYKKNNRNIGIEFEFISSKNIKNLAHKYQLNDLINNKDESIYKENFWDIKEDDSIIVPEGHYPVEIVSPIISKDNYNENMKFMKHMINESSLNINDSCALHIHVDINDIIDCNEFVKTNLKHDFYIIQELLYMFCNEKRQDNPYCPKYEKNQDRIIEKQYKKKLAQYRAGINLFTGLGTIEFRMKESIKDYNEIIFWIDLCHDITNFIVNKQYYSSYINEYKMLKEKIITHQQYIKKSTSQVNEIFDQIEKTFNF